jgi:hypothetical protein
LTPEPETANAAVMNALRVPLLLTALLTLSFLKGVEASESAFEMGELSSKGTVLHALITPEIVTHLLSNPVIEPEELTDDEARARALPAGIELPAIQSQAHFDHPWVVLKAGIGIPNLVSAQIEIFVHRNWTLNLTTGRGLLPAYYEGLIRWRPEATCWGCDGKNFVSIGFGVGPGFYLDGPRTGVVVTSAVDLMYIHRFAEHFGLMIGTSIGAGLTQDYYSDGTSSRIEPMFHLNLIQVGIAF